MKKVWVLFSLLFSVFFLSCELETAEEKHISILEFQKSSVELNIGDSQTVYIKYQPQDVKPEISYSVSTEGIIKLSGQSNEGVVITGISAGSAIVIAKCEGLTAYLEVKVGTDVTYIDPYIVLPYTSLEVEKGKNINIIASLYGGKASDNSQFRWTCNSSCITYEAAGNCLNITAVKSGVAKITVEHQKSKYSSSMLVIIPDGVSSPKYISTTDNVIKVYKGGEPVTISTEIRGGSDADNLYTSFAAVENPGIIGLSYSNGRCDVIGKECGVAVIRASNSLCNDSIDITVIVSDKTEIGYITCNNDFIIIEGNNYAIVSARLIMDDEKDYSRYFSYEVKDPDIVECSNDNNLFYIYGKKDGITTVTVKNDYCDIPHDIMVIVQNNNLKSKINYISPENNFIKLENNNEEYELKVTLIGGNEADKNNFSYEVSDSSVIELITNEGTVSYSRSAAYVQPDTYQTKCIIIPKRIGSANIKISNPKTTSQANVTVVVYPVGTLNKNENTLKGEGVYKVIKGQSEEIILGVDGDINTLGNLEWNTEDENICSVNGNLLNGVLSGINSGVTQLNVNNQNLSNEFSSVVVCGTESELENTNVFYLDNKNLTLSKDTKTYYELKSLSEIDRNKYVISSNDETVCKATVNDGIIALDALNEGETTLVVTNENLKDYRYIINITVFDAAVSLQYPYSITGPDYIGIVLGQKKTVEFNLKNAAEREYENITYLKNNENISIKGNGNQLSITALSLGESMIKVSHPSARYSKTVYVYIAQTESELKDRIMFFSEKSNYVANKGDSIYLKVTSNNENIYKDIVWSVSELSKATIQDSGNYALVNLKEEGFVKITASYGNNAFYFFYITIKDEQNYKPEESVFGLPSIVEIITGNTKKIEINCNDLSSNELLTVQWKCNNSGLEVQGNGAECLIKGVSKGVYELKVESSYLNINKTIMVVVGDTVEDFKNKYVMNIEKNTFNIKKNNGIEASLLFGSYLPDDNSVSSIEWKTDDTDIIELVHYGNKDKCFINAINEGSAVITISSPKFANELSVRVNVYENEESPYGFVTDRIIKIVCGKTKNSTFSVINLINNKEIADYSRVNIKDISNDCITVSLAQKNIRIKAERSGTSVITLYHPELGIEAAITVICADTQEALNEVFTITSKKDHYLLDVNQSIVLNLITENSEDSRNANIAAECDNTSVVEIIKQDNLSYFITGIKEGNAVLTFKAADYEYNVYIAVSKNIKGIEPQIITENILSLVKGVKYTSTVIGPEEIAVGTDSELFLVERSGNTFTVEPYKCGEGEITVYAKGYERVIKVVISETENEACVQKIMNIDKRHYYMTLNSSVSVIPGFFSMPFEYQIQTEDIYDNKVIKTEIKNNRIYVHAINPGIAQLKVSVEGYGSVILTFEVDEEKSLDGIVENVKYNIYSDMSVVFIEPDKYKTLIITVDGLESGESLNDGYIWETDKPSFVKLNPFGYFCNVTPLVSEGECNVTVRNPQCNNIYTFKIKIGHTVENSGTTIPYIYIPVNTVSLKYGEGTESIEVTLKNMDNYSVKDLTITDNKSGIVKYSRLNTNGKCIITLQPVSCGYGRLTLHHPYSSADSYIDYIVQDKGNTDIVYLTTSDNYVTMKSGEIKEINVSLENYEEINGKKFEYEYDSSYLYIIGEGPKVQLQGLKEGITTVKVRHPQSQNSLEITVNISNKNISAKYFTTANNVIETTVSSVMDSFMVTLVGDNLSTNAYKYESSDYSVLSVIGQENYCFYRGLSKGQAQITVSHKTDPSVLPITVTVIVEDNDIDGQFITSNDKLLYLAPQGQNKGINVTVNNVKNFDESRLDWSIYSQQNTNGSSGDVIRLNGSGKRGVITPLSEGIAKVRVCYTPLNLKLDIAIFVSPFGEITFSESSIRVPVGDMYFESISVPAVSNNLNDIVKYRVDNDSICEVFGTGKVCCIRALKTGTAIVHAVNTYDNTETQLTVQVYDESIESVNKINLSQTSYLFNPRSQPKTIKATLSGKDFKESDKEDIEWSIEGNTCVNIYPKKGPEVTISLNADPKNGKVNTGSAVISVTHNKCDNDYKKTIYIDVSELQNYFTLSTDRANVDSGSTFTVTANIVGASIYDYDDVHWSIQRQKVEADGTVTTIAQVLNDSGKTCTIMGIEEGSVVLNCFYKGDLKTCDIQVKGNRYFSVLTNSVQMFPGQEYKIGYNLRPNTYSVTWFTSCQGDVISIVKDDHDEQEITIKAHKEGNSTITGVVNGIGTVMISVRSVYNPKLFNTSKESTFFIPMFDKGTANYEKHKNEVEINFLCYPPEYYVKVTPQKSSSGITEEYFDYIVEQNHDSISVNPKAGEGKIRIIANKEIPLTKKQSFTVTQYSDPECTKVVDKQNFNFAVYALFTKDDCITPDDEYDIFFKRYDGGFSMPNAKYDSPNHDMMRIDKNTNFVFGEGETHYIIIKPKHEGQYFEANISAKGTDDFPFSATPFVNNNGMFVSEIRTYNPNEPNGMRDHGYDGSFDFKNNTWTKPTKASSSFYPRFAIKKPYLSLGGKKYYFTSSNINYSSTLAHKPGRFDGDEFGRYGDAFINWNRFWHALNCQTYNIIEVLKCDHHEKCGYTEELLVFDIPYKSSLGRNHFPIIVDSKENVVKKLFSNSATFNLCDDWYGTGGYFDKTTETIGAIVGFFTGNAIVIRRGNHAYVELSGRTSTVSIGRDSNFTIYNSKSSCEFNYGNGWIDYIWGKSYVVGDGTNCRFYPSNNTTPVKTNKEDSKKITLTIKVNSKDVINTDKVIINVRECYRNYYQYSYDKDGNPIITINDITNDEFKKITWN